MIKNHSFSYPTWEELTSEKYNSIATELKLFGSRIPSKTQADPAGTLQNFTLKLWENPYIYYQIEKQRVEAFIRYPKKKRIKKNRKNI